MIIAGRRGDLTRDAACVVLATTRGLRRLKIAVTPGVLAGLPHAEVIEGLAS